MKKFVAIALAGLACGAAPLGGAQDALPEPANKVIDFHKDIAPIFAENCLKCHGEEKQKSDYRLDSRKAALESGKEGGAIVVGNSADSLMLGLITGTNADFDIMPPKGDSLTPEQIGLIRAWIDQGAVWEDDGAPAAQNDRESFAGLGEQWFVEATHQKGPLATWEMVPEKGPTGETCVALTQPNHSNAGTFNLLWDRKTPFKDGRIDVNLKAVSGEEDQGGGLIWRARDKDNYYIARFNPLEKNLRLYQVTAGKREQLASAEVEKSAGAWVSLAVEQAGGHIKVSLDGQVLIEADADAHGDAGGIGLWTKADAATVFTKPVVQPN